jgi:hypothetical protein
MPEHELPTVAVTTNEPILDESMAIENPVTEPINELITIARPKKDTVQIPPRLRSRKLWALITGIIALIVSIYLPELEEVTTEITTIIGGYILGQGAVDVAKEIK